MSFKLHFEKKGLIHSGRIFSGLFMISLGVLFLLKNLKLLNFSIFHFALTYWPLFLVLIGLSMVLRSKFLSFIFVIILIVALTSHFYLGQDFEKRVFVKTEALDSRLNTMDLDLNFGAGELNIGKGRADELIRYSIETYDSINPDYYYTRSSGVANVFVSRNFKDNIVTIGKGNDIWNVNLTAQTMNNLDLNFGAVDADIDLRGINVNLLDIDCGASDVEITFDRFPTIATIGSGASSFTFRFPKGYSVKIISEGGLVNNDLMGFTKKDGVFYSSDFSEDEYIEIDINSGVSDFSATFY